MRTNHIELLEWVSGGIPAFDNVSFTDSEEFGEFIPNDQERANKIQDLRKLATGFDDNNVSGNRANLLFVDQCNQMIQQNQSLINNSLKSQQINLNQTGKSIIQF